MTTYPSLDLNMHDEALTWILFLVGFVAFAVVWHKVTTYFLDRQFPPDNAPLCDDCPTFGDPPSDKGSDTFSK